MRRSVFYDPLAYFVSYFVASLYALTTSLRCASSALGCACILLGGNTALVEGVALLRSVVLRQPSGCSHPEPSIRSSGLATGYIEGGYLLVGALLLGFV